MTGTVPRVFKPGDAFTQYAILVGFWISCKFTPPAIYHGFWHCIRETEGYRLDQFRRVQMGKVSARVPAFVIRVGTAVNAGL